MKPTTDYHALVAAPVPRDPTIVAPYVDRATKTMRNTVWVFVALYLGLATLGSAIDMSRPNTDPWWESIARGFGYSIVPALFIIGPALLFWHVNRTSMRELATKGHLLPASVSMTETINFRGTKIPSAAVTFVDETGRQREARFQGKEAGHLAVGNTVQVLRNRGSSVAVLWPPDVLVMARLS